MLLAKYDDQKDVTWNELKLMNDDASLKQYHFYCLLNVLKSKV